MIAWAIDVKFRAGHLVLELRELGELGLGLGGGASTRYAASYRDWRLCLSFSVDWLERVRAIE